MGASRWANQSPTVTDEHPMIGSSTGASLSKEGKQKPAAGARRLVHRMVAGVERKN